MTVVGVIGLGFMGKVHLEAYRQIPGVTVGAVASTPGTGAEDVAEQIGARYYPDAVELLADPSVEAVSITVPTHLHREITVAAIEAGKHVLVEKPLGLTAEDCAEIVARAAGKDLVVTVGHVLRFWPAYVRVVDLVASGRLGKPIAAFAERLSAPPRWSSWLANPRLSGGAVHDFHIHDLDILNWIFGEPDVVYASGTRGDGGGWDSVVSSIRYGSATSPVWAVASASTLLPNGYPFTTRLRVLCESGAVEYTEVFDGEQVDSGSEDGARIRVYEGDGKVSALDVDDTRDPYLLEVMAFVEAVRGGGHPSLLAAGSLAVSTALAARRSLESGALEAV